MTLRVVAGYIGTHDIELNEGDTWSAEKGELRIKNDNGNVIQVIFDVKKVVLL